METYLRDGGRRSPAAARLAWDSRRREQYLLRVVDYPISFDARVLPFAVDDEKTDEIFTLVAGVLVAPGTEKVIDAWQSNEALQPLPEAPDGWIPLGFDVCDEFGYSGLSNCSYASDDRAHIARSWSARLDHSHLLTSAEDADEFRRFTDRRVPAHAPFVVLHLYRRA
jgi:hypothetical protein